MQTIEIALDRLLARIAEQSGAFESHLNSLPSSQPCPRHPDQTAVLLIDPSWRQKRPVYGCPMCADEVRAKRRARRLHDAGLPADVRHATIENFQTDRPGIETAHHTPSQFIEAARRFQAGDARNLILSGKPGIGKGHLAGALAIAALDAGRTVAWTDCASLFQAYHDAYRDNTTAAVVNRHAQAALLVLDELGLRDLPADGEEILFAILDRRHKDLLPTILLGNQPAEITKKWLGGRITDRLRSGGCILRYGEWESMRGKDGDGAGDEF
ncbi:MAG: putative replication protein DnaC [Verrucomicrobiaceae bacterium]|nr:putative replication protein DnaC [Verrucomicrobiaceae bacterium]